MSSIIASVDPAWISNALFVVGGFIARKYLTEIKEMRKDLDSIRLLLAREYPTKEEVKEIAINVAGKANSELYDRIVTCFLTRHEGEDLKEQIHALIRKHD